MPKLDLSQLSNNELKIELKKRKQGYQIAAFMVGMMIGCAVWTIFKNGFTWFLIVPFGFAYWFRNAKPEYEEVKKEIESRS
jgi:uncharacterized protein HemY